MNVQREYNTKEKNEIVNWCWNVYVTKQENGSLNCSDFYALVYAATPPDTWLHISWLGRCIHSFYRDLEDTPVEAPAANPNKKRAVSSKGKNLTTLTGVAFIDKVDTQNASPDLVQLMMLCAEHTIPFIDSLQHEQVKKAKETINLFYTAVQSDVSVAKTFFSFLKGGLGFESQSTVANIREELNSTIIAKYKEHSLIRVPKNIRHPPFIVFTQSNTITIEISTFHLKYTIGLCTGVLTVTFSSNNDSLHPEAVIIASAPEWKKPNEGELVNFLIFI